MKSKSKLLILLFFLPILFSQTQFDFPPHTQVLNHNLNLTLPAPIPDTIQCNKGSYKNPIECAYTRAKILPSVDNRISINSNSTLFLIWGVNAPQKITYTSQSGGCAPDKYVFTRTSQPKLTGTIIYQIKNYSKTIPIQNYSTKLNLSQIPDAVLTTKNASPFLPKLNLHINAEIQADYALSHYYYRLLIIGKTAICKQYVKYSKSTYTYPITSQSSYLIEYGQPYFILTQPIDKEQTNYNPQLKTAILTNQEAQKIIFLSNQNNLAQTNLSKYKIIQEQSGFQNIIKLNSTKNQSLKTNYTNQFLSAPEFSDTNYAYQYYSHYSGLLPISFSNLTLILEDDFSNNYSKTLQLKSSKLSAISLNNTKLTIENRNKTKINTFTKDYRQQKTITQKQTFSKNIFEFFAPVLLFALAFFFILKK